MDAQELFLADKRSAGVWYCTGCKQVRRTKAEADACCVPHACDDCGQPTEGTYTMICSPCRSKRERASEDARAAKAKPSTDWDGYVYSGGTYYSDMDELLQAMEDDESQPPDYVWPCKSTPIVAVDWDNICESICEDAYEDFDERDIHGVPEFRAAIAAFNAANKDMIAYNPDYKQVIWIDKIVKHEGDRDE